MRIKWKKEVFSLFFFMLWKHNPVVESEGNFESEFRSIVSLIVPKYHHLKTHQNRTNCVVA